MGFEGGYVGGKLFDNVRIDASDSGIRYSEKIGVRHSSVWSAQFRATEVVATFAATIELWATDEPDPSDDDTDWVLMTSTHGWDGFPAGNPAGGDYNDLIDVGVAGARYYRFKVTRTTGEADLGGFFVQKQNS